MHSGCFATSSHFAIAGAAGGNDARLAHVCRQCYRLLPESEQEKYTVDGELEVESAGALHLGDTVLVHASPRFSFWVEEVAGVDPREFLILEARVGVYIQQEFPWSRCEPHQTITLLVERTARSPGKFRALLRGPRAPLPKSN